MADLQQEHAVIWEALRSMRSVKLHVTGRSMWPSIRHGDMVEIEPTGERELQLGEIVLVKSLDQNPLVHRIIQVFEDAVITQGDRAWKVDGLIRKEHILGRVVGLRRRGSWFRLDRKIDRFTGVALAKTLPLAKKIIHIGRRTKPEIQELRIR